MRAEKKCVAHPHLEECCSAARGTAGSKRPDKMCTRVVKGHSSNKEIVTGLLTCSCLWWKFALLSGKWHQPAVAQLELMKGDFSQALPRAANTLVLIKKPILRHSQLQGDPHWVIHMLSLLTNILLKQEIEHPTATGSPHPPCLCFSLIPFQSSSIPTGEGRFHWGWKWLEPPPGVKAAQEIPLSPWTGFEASARVEGHHKQSRRFA